MGGFAIRQQRIQMFMARGTDSFFRLLKMCLLYRLSRNCTKTGQSKKLRK
jgi:hypothetical protein